MTRRLRVWKERPTAQRASWSVVYERPGGGRGRRTVKDAASALRLVREIRRYLDDEEDPVPRTQLAHAPEPPLTDMAHAWLDDLERARKTATVLRHQNSLLLLVQFLEERTGRPEANLRGADITTSALREYVDWLATPGTGRSRRKTGRRPGTIKKALETARLFAAWASRDDRFRDFIREPALLPLPPGDESRAEAPTWEQMGAAIAAANLEYLRRAMVVMYFTGLRVNLQVMQLRWSDVCLQDGLITIRRPELCKSAYERKIARTIPTSPQLLSALKRWHRDDKARPDDYVIALTGSGKNTSDREIRGRDTKRAWVRALGEWPTEWKLPNHCFRRGFVTGLRRLGVDQEVISYLAGQKSPFLVSSTYTDLQVLHGAAMRAAVGKIPELPGL
jgi:integrase